MWMGRGWGWGVQDLKAAVLMGLAEGLKWVWGLRPCTEEVLRAHSSLKEVMWSPSMPRYCRWLWPSLLGKVTVCPSGSVTLNSSWKATVNYRGRRCVRRTRGAWGGSWWCLAGLPCPGRRVIF